MNAITHTTLALTAAMLLATTVHAEQFWVAYEGDVLPDQVGWTRQDSEWYLGKRADVYVRDGVLTIDSLEDIGIYDYFVYEPSQPITLAPGEELVVQMRVRASTMSYHYSFDAGVGIVANDSTATLGLANDYLYYSAPDGSKFRAEIATTDWRTYEIRSDDLETFRVYVDGESLLTSTFWLTSNIHNRVAFGDIMLGAASLSQWDYVRFGVVPEPTTAVLLVAGAAAMIRRPIRRRRA